MRCGYVEYCTGTSRYDRPRDTLHTPRSTCRRRQAIFSRDAPGVSPCCPASRLGCRAAAGVYQCMGDIEDSVICIYNKFATQPQQQPYVGASALPNYESSGAHTPLGPVTTPLLRRPHGQAAPPTATTNWVFTFLAHPLSLLLIRSSARNNFSFHDLGYPPIHIRWLS